MLPRVWTWIRRDTTSTDWLIVLLTAVIAGTSYLQWNEIRSGGQDTHDLAVAAKRQADKAETISNSLTNAVDKLGQQAKAAQDSATAIQKQTTQDQRASL